MPPMRIRFFFEITNEMSCFLRSVAWHNRLPASTPGMLSFPNFVCDRILSAHTPQYFHLRQADAARQLGISPSTIRRRLTELKLHWPRTDKQREQQCAQLSSPSSEGTQARKRHKANLDDANSDTAATSNNPLSPGGSLSFHNHYTMDPDHPTRGSHDDATKLFAPPSLSSHSSATSNNASSQYNFSNSAVGPGSYSASSFPLPQNPDVTRTDSMSNTFPSNRIGGNNNLNLGRSSTSNNGSQAASSNSDYQMNVSQMQNMQVQNFRDLAQLQHQLEHQKMLQMRLQERMTGMPQQMSRHNYMYNGDNNPMQRFPMSQSDQQYQQPSHHNINFLQQQPGSLMGDPSTGQQHQSVNDSSSTNQDKKNFPPVALKEGEFYCSYPGDSNYVVTKVSYLQTLMMTLSDLQSNLDDSKRNIRELQKENQRLQTLFLQSLGRNENNNNGDGSFMMQKDKEVAGETQRDQDRENQRLASSLMDPNNIIKDNTDDPDDVSLLSFQDE